MFKIAFIATGYIKKYDGISVYTENLLKEFLLQEIVQRGEIDVDIYIGKSVRGLLENRILDNTALENIHFVEVADQSFLHKISDLFFKLLKNGRYKIVFATNFMPIFLIPSKVVKVIHDLSPEISPHLYSRFFRLYHTFLLRMGKYFDTAIGYISESTKSDLNRFYNIDRENKALIYLPNGIPFKVQHYERPSTSILQKYDNPVTSFLVVGRINRAKGFDRVLTFCDYFDRYLQKSVDTDSAVLHIVGKQTSETEQIFKNAAYQKIEVIFHGYMEDTALNRLYTESQFCFFLSRNEGYGLPLVEALWFRCIPILSDIPIFNEIMGDEYPKFNDKTGYKESINKFLQQILKDKEILKLTSDRLELIVEKERYGYMQSAKNLAMYIQKIKKGIL
ncbi:MAG: glycosyltransferase [Epsilonproteobacteria bacterium]|nr:glycosyltransferase [Campylobacterota bacterium]